MNQLRVLVLFVLASVSMVSHASFIAGNYTLSNGNAVDLQGLEWMPLTYTAGLSRVAIESPNGFTDRFGNEWAANDWRYATREETEKLLGSLWDNKYEGWSSTNYTGAHWFLSEFGGLAFDSGVGQTRTDGQINNEFWQGYDHSFFYFGNFNECSSNENEACRGHLISALSYAHSLQGINVISTNMEQSYKASTLGVGWMSEVFGVDMGLLSYNATIDISYTSLDTGSLLVRNTKLPDANEVTSPSVFGLMLIGLCVFARNSRFRALT